MKTIRLMINGNWKEFNYSTISQLRKIIKGELGNGVELGNDVELGNWVELGNDVKLGYGVKLGNIKSKES
jgi:hypothetical protein